MLTFKNRLYYMKKIIKSFLLSLSFIFISNQSFAINNNTYLICKKEDENKNKICKILTIKTKRKFS